MMEPCWRRLVPQHNSSCRSTLNSVSIPFFASFYMISSVASRAVPL